MGRLQKTFQVFKTWKVYGGCNSTPSRFQKPGRSMEGVTPHLPGFKNLEGVCVN